MSSSLPPSDLRRDPLHGLTLEAIVTALVAEYDWPGLGERIPIRCFLSDPSVKSILAFLRRTPWARAKVESRHLLMLRDRRRRRSLPKRYAPRPVRSPSRLRFHVFAAAWKFIGTHKQYDSVDAATVEMK